MSVSGSCPPGISGFRWCEYPYQIPRRAVELGLASIEGWKEPWLMYIDFLASFTIIT